MTSETILRKAIEKAIKNGWHGEYLGKLTIWQQDNGIVRIKNNLDEEWSVEEIIYNHKFARALFGEELIPNELFSTTYQPEETKYYTTRPAWQTHLMHMVIDDDPIKYLEEHI